MEKLSDLHLFHLGLRPAEVAFAIRFSIGAGANFQSGHERAYRRLGNEHECKYFPAAACLLRNESTRVLSCCCGTHKKQTTCTDDSTRDAHIPKVARSLGLINCVAKICITRGVCVSANFDHVVV